MRYKSTWVRSRGRSIFLTEPEYAIKKEDLKHASHELLQKRAEDAAKNN